MKIIDIKLLRGPNYWSNRRHKLVVMKLDLEKMEFLPSHKIEGFYERIKKLLPSLYEHHCSEGHDGGFLERVKEGTWMGHIIEHVALEIQTLAGIDCGFGRTRGAEREGVYYVVFNYIYENAGTYAAQAAVRIVEAIIVGDDYNLETDIEQLKVLKDENKLGPSTQSIINEADKRGIPFTRLNEDSLFQLGYGVNQKRIIATITSQTSNLGVDLAGDKEDTKLLLHEAGIPVPFGGTCIDAESLKNELQRVGYPCVIKPVNGNHGNGATTNVKKEAEAIIAFKLAQKFSNRIIVERWINGLDYRLLVINYKLVAAAKRTPAHIIGDGQSTIQELIDEVNADPRRGSGHENMLTKIEVDKMTQHILNFKKVKLNSVLQNMEVLYLKTTANLSTGGTSEDITDTVHPENVLMAERISRIIGLDICGIDIMVADLKTPIKENGGAVIEVNAAPGFRMHLDPTIGKPRNVAKPVIDMLFPPGQQARIPIVAVTGTNGKTTTTRLIAHIMKTSGFKVGFTTSEGIYIQGIKLQDGDCTGPKSAKFVLNDPTVNFAVLETARGGILREGLGFSQCDVGIVTNIASDHLGLKGINSLEQLALVKSVVVENVTASGYSILNADDANVLNMRDKIKSKIALFSLDENNNTVVEHCKSGGIAVVLENGYISIIKGDKKIRVEKVKNIPLTFSGRALFMIQNVLPATLSAYLQNVQIEDLRLALRTFIPCPSQTPGRMNIFQFKSFEVLLDYAHNPSGMRAIGEFLKETKGFPKIGVIAATGDRRDKDIVELGKMSGSIFDEIIIRQDADLRGRNPNDIYNLLMEGIRRASTTLPVTYIPDEKTAITHSILEAKPGSFITIICDLVPRSIGFVTELMERENKQEVLKNDISNIEVYL